MSWRSWWDGGTDGPIADRWAVEGWPAVFVIDHQGVVRYKGALIVNNGKVGRGGRGREGGSARVSLAAQPKRMRQNEVKPGA
jgi:hypothetical protein